MKKTLFLCCFLMSIMLIPGSVQAQGPKVAIGLGAGAAPEFEGSDEYEGVPLVFLDAQWANHMSVSVMGNAGRINLVPHPIFRAGLAMEYMGERDDVESTAVDALPDVDSSFMVGGFLGFDYNRWNASLEVLTDIADGNDGTIARVRAGYGVPIKQTMNLNIGVFTTWANDDYMESYFAVTSDGSAASGLATHEADSGVKDVGLSLSLHYTPWQHWGILGLCTYGKFLGDAKDSPIVDQEGDSYPAFIGAMVTYRF